MDKTAQEHMTEMAQKPTLDEFFTREAKGRPPTDFEPLVKRFQDERTLFVNKGEKVREEKEDSDALP